MREVWRAWSPIDPATPWVASVQQSLSARRGVRRAAAVRLLLTLRRHASVDAAAEALDAPPEAAVSGGGELRPYRGRAIADRADALRVFEWSRRDGETIAEQLFELRLQRETAVATLLAHSARPDPDWERQLGELMASVGGRLR